MKLVCHIGIAEAAAAHIQDSLAANNDWLLTHGLAYADLLSPTPNHITLFFACASEVHRLAQDYGLSSPKALADFRVELAAHIDAQIADPPARAHTLVMSSPALTGLMRREGEIARLHELLAPRFEEVKILVYVRRQDDALLLKYNELIRRGQSRATFPDFVETCLGSDNPMPHLDYQRALAPWLRVWGRDSIVLRRFSAVDFIQDNVLADVMGVLLETWEPDLTGLRPAPDPARVVSAPALEFLRQIHPAVPFIKEGRPNPQRRALMPAINALPEQPRPIMPAALSHQIMGHYRASNNWLSTQFTDTPTAPFFPHRPDHPDHGTLGHLSPRQATGLAGQLLGHGEASP